MAEIKGFAGFDDKAEEEKKELDGIEEVKMYMVNGQLFDDLETAKVADAYNDLGVIIADMFYPGMNESGLMDEILEHKVELFGVLKRLQE